MSAAPKKVALVTGAARGIGLAVAKKFLAEGWRVALLDVEGELLWNSVAALAANGDAIGLNCDVSDARAVASAISEIERRFGRLDALVNNGVAPGPVETAMAKAVHTPEIRADYRDAIPLSRYGLEEELAEAVFFLCSDRSSYITGQILAVDGGFDAAGIGLATLRGERRNG